MRVNVVSRALRKYNCNLDRPSGRPFERRKGYDICSLLLEGPRQHSKGSLAISLHHVLYNPISQTRYSDTIAETG